MNMVLMMMLLESLPSLSARREILLYKFAAKCERNPETTHMIPIHQNSMHMNLREKEKYSVPKCRTTRRANSAIPTMIRLLNSKPPT